MRNGAHRYRCAPLTVIRTPAESGAFCLLMHRAVKQHEEQQIYLVILRLTKEIWTCYNITSELYPNGDGYCILFKQSPKLPAHN